MFYINTVEDNEHYSFNYNNNTNSNSLAHHQEQEQNLLVKLIIQGHTIAFFCLNSTKFHPLNATLALPFCFSAKV